MQLFAIAAIHMSVHILSISFQNTYNCVHILKPFLENMHITFSNYAYFRDNQQIYADYLNMAPDFQVKCTYFWSFFEIYAQPRAYFETFSRKYAQYPAPPK